MFGVGCRLTHSQTYFLSRRIISEEADERKMLISDMETLVGSVELFSTNLLNCTGHEMRLGERLLKDLCSQCFKMVVLQTIKQGLFTLECLMTVSAKMVAFFM